MKIAIFIMFFISSTCTASIYQVGSTKTYASPNALFQAGIVKNGDTIYIDAELYSGSNCLAVWQKHNLLIKGVGGRPHLEANGQYIFGKGIWVLAGNNITIENIEFSGASVPDLNGAGIRLDGVGLTVRHCYFHNNENGILTSNPYEGDILIEFSEFDNNGAGDGFSHNLYIGHVNKLTFRFNYSHHASIGHNLKSRANENYILYNRIMDEEEGESSRLIDLSNGGFSIIMGNLLMQGNKAQNNNLLGYGREGLTNTLSELYFINNTSVNKRSASCIFVDIEDGTAIANITNNVFAGTGIVIKGTTTTMSNNIIDSNIDNMYFVDEPNFDYNLNSNSPAIDAGIDVTSISGYSLTPDSTYAHPTNFSKRANDTTIDAGAYEYKSPSSTLIAPEDKIVVFPNPFTDIITIKDIILNPSEISLFTISGQDLSTLISIDMENNNTVLNTSKLPKGTYILKARSFAEIINKQ